MARTASSDMAKIIADAYRIFARYTLHAPLQVCHCNVCVSDDDFQKLSRTPLHMIPSALLAEYTNSAHGADDGIISEQMRYFLPRYFDIMAVAEAPCHMGTEFSLSRLRGMAWRTLWPEEERAVVEQFFDALIVEWIDDYRLHAAQTGLFLDSKIKDILVMIILAGGDIHRALRSLEQAPDPHAAIHIAALRLDTAWYGSDVLLRSAFLNDHAEQAKAVGAFVHQPAWDRRMEAAFFAIQDSQLQKFLSDTLP